MPDKNQKTEEEAKFDDVLKRLLNTPPKRKKATKKKAKRKTG